ncbi:MAG: YihA family ribosome biogenesis GTP-binding protein [candidate division Zixibacteria bacterium]|nr:YihA family ribosome biogenesis GTP-binding protein [candidate division Zixibacteria bacterium]
MGVSLLAAKFVSSIYDNNKVPSDNRSSVAVSGRSNVGKSTLINTITQGKKVAKVSSTPGKTQALNFFITDDKFYLVDLPGYGFAKVPLAVKKSWGKLVEGYLTGDPSLKGLVMLLDCRREIQPDDMTMMQWVINRDLPFVIVLTKTDKLSKSRLIQTVRKMKKNIFGDENAGNLIPFSARTNLGKNEVIQWIRKAVA